MECIWKACVFYTGVELSDCISTDDLLRVETLLSCV
jgi:hypothetical protein